MSPLPGAAERNKIPFTVRHRGPVPQDVDIAIMCTNLEKHVLPPVPLVEHLLDHVLMVVQPEPNRPLIGDAARVALYLQSHSHLS